MNIRVQASPRLRDRRTGKEVKPEHRFVVRDTPESDKPRRVGATAILKVAIGLIVFLAGGLGIFSVMQGPDPHYVKAAKLVHDYEFGRPVESRNYEHRIYGDALDELALVNPRSKSAEAAESLKMEIERGITEFRRRQAVIEKSLDLARTKKQRRDTAERHARLRARALPETDYPECDYEENR